MILYMSLGKNEQVFYMGDCNCNNRAQKWIGALLGNKNIGCGINVLVFLELLNESHGKGLVPRLDLRKGTPFQTIVEHVQQLSAVPLEEQIFPVTTLIEVTRALDIIQDGLIQGKTERKTNDACTIIKLNRAAGVGHTVIMSVEGNTLYTVDPQASTFRKRNDSKIFLSWSGEGGYRSISLIVGKMPKKATPSKSSQGHSPFFDSIEMPPKVGLTPEKTIQEILGVSDSTYPSLSTAPVDLLNHGKVYAILCHGSLMYEPIGPHVTKKPFSMPKDRDNNYYDFECLKVPSNVVLNTLSRVGQSLHVNDNSLRVRAGIVHEILSGKFDFEQWGGVKGKEYSFPNYALSRDRNKWITTGIYQKLGQGRDVKSIRTVLDMQKGDESPIFGFDTDTGKIGVYPVSTDLKHAIQGILEDAGKTKEMIYIYCSFCLGSIAPVSYDKINKCISKHFLGVPPKKAARRKVSRRKIKKKSSRRK